MILFAVFVGEDRQHAYAVNQRVEEVSLLRRRDYEDGAGAVVCIAIRLLGEFCKYLIVIRQLFEVESLQDDGAVGVGEYRIEGDSAGFLQFRVEANLRVAEDGDGDDQLLLFEAVEGTALGVLSKVGRDVGYLIL